MPQKPRWFGISQQYKFECTSPVFIFSANPASYAAYCPEIYLPIGEVVVINWPFSYVHFTYSILDEIAEFLVIASKNIVELTMAVFTPVTVRFIYWSIIATMVKDSVSAERLSQIWCSFCIQVWSDHSKTNLFETSDPLHSVSVDLVWKVCVNIQLCTFTSRKFFQTSSSLQFSPSFHSVTSFNLVPSSVKANIVDSKDYHNNVKHTCWSRWKYKFILYI